MTKEYSISKTTKEERKKYLEYAEAIAAIDSPEPPEEDKKLIQEYIEGKSELNEILKKAIEKYKK